MIEINVRELKYRIVLKNIIYFVLDMVLGEEIYNISCFYY